MSLQNDSTSRIFPSLTTRQFLYVLLMHSIGAGILDAGINFAIAYAMYKGNPTFLWALPNTIAGDTAVTCLIQVTLTWIIDGGLTHSDVRKGTVQPIITGKQSWTLLRRGFMGWLTRSSLDIFAPVSISARLRRLGEAALRGLVFSVCVLPLAWGIAVGLACATWPGLSSGNAVEGLWGPQIFKGLYAFVLGAFTTPVSTLVAMAQAGDASELDESPDTTLEDIQSIPDNLSPKILQPPTTAHDNSLLYVRDNRV